MLMKSIDDKNLGGSIKTVILYCKGKNWTALETKVIENQ